MSKITVIDKFLPYEQLVHLRDLCYFNEKFAYHIHRSVAYSDDKSENWNWYGTHMFYENMAPSSQFYEVIANLFLQTMHDRFDLQCFYRVKGNFYPWTEKLYQHPWHTDYYFPHKGALFTINTCDGYTEFKDGTKVESVENRMLLFDPCVEHRSTTTTDSKGRYNINFNYF